MTTRGLRDRCRCTAWWPWLRRSNDMHTLTHNASNPNDLPAMRALDATELERVAAAGSKVGGVGDGRNLPGERRAT